MRISFEWLAELVDLEGVTPREVADALTRVGIEIENVTSIDLSDLVIGRVLKQEPHPTSRNPLWVHEVDLGSETRTIVAGAPNAVAGTLVPVALPGTTVPNGTLVRDAKIAGVPAQGMLCSADELLICDERVRAILLLDRGEPGRPLTDVLPSEAILEAEVNSNRPDCLGHVGVAREVAAALDRPLRRDFMPAFTGGVDPPGGDLVKIAIEAEDLCARYIGGVVTGVRVGPSPLWLHRRLCSAGVRPINNLVDITNYVLLEYAQPLHVFDLRKLHGPEIRVRRAAPGERLLCLDGVERELTPEMLVIADSDRPVAIAGVMGGDETAVAEDTVDVLLEAATFDGPNVRRTARALGLRTEASSRFERGLPPELALAGARRAAALLAELAGGQVHREWPDVYPRPQEPVRVRVHPDKVDAVLGTHVDVEESEDILRRLGFHVRGADDGAWDVLPPVWRLDVGIAEDVVEEVGRVYGYDRIPPALPGRRHQRWEPARPSIDRRLDSVREVLAGAGFSETWTPALVPHRELAELGLGERALRVSNPVSDEMDGLRTSLLPSLLGAAALNRDRGRERPKLFEVAPAFLATENGAQPDEPLRLAAVLAAGGDGRAAFLELKAVVDRCAHALGAPGVEYAPAHGPLHHPGRTAMVSLGGAALGLIGEAHPRVAEHYGIDGRVTLLELDLAPLLAAAAPVRVQPLPRFPAAGRELNVVVAEHVPARDVLAAAGAAGGELLAAVTAVDEYRGAQLGDGLKSLNLALTFRSGERTLTDPEVDDAMNTIRQALQSRLGASFRG
jgi:phenylalanyl-tRNA synthetase beta chain